MKTFFLLGFLFSFLFLPLMGQGVTIGSNQPPNPSAGIDMQFQDKGLLIPRLTTAQRNAIVNPALGLQIINLTTECLEIYFASGWKAVACNCTAPPATPSLSGPAQFCVNQSNVTYTVAPQADASSYTWTLPSGATMVSGQGTSSIVVNMGSTGGTISVVAQNSCGTSGTATLNINPSIPVATFSPVAGGIQTPITFFGPAGMSTYAWTFPSGTPATASTQNPQVTWNQAGSFAVKLVVTNAVGCVDSMTQTVVLTSCQPLVYTFTTCGATGQFGPSASQCNAAYGPGVVSVSGGIQSWTVPFTGNYRIQVRGAQGGDGYPNSSSSLGQGGGGIIMTGDVSLTQGDVLQLLVGQKGGTPPTNGSPGGGGGGSFIVRNGNPLLIAGGGAGFGNYNAATGVTTTSGGNNGGGSGGGVNGQGGTGGSRGGGGGGWSTDGGMATLSPAPSMPGIAFLNGGNGGAPANWGCDWTSGSGSGGFGGGASGGGACNSNGGAGGGYSGGAGPSNNVAGGGGSFVANGITNLATSNGAYNGNSQFASQTIQNLGQFQTGSGQITITRICP